MDRAMYEVNWTLEDRHWWFKARRRIFIEILARHLPPSDGHRPRILELGCGTGGNLPALANLGDVVGVEADSVAADWARSKTGVDVVHDKLPDCSSLPDAAFHAVGLFDVLEHMQDEVASLRSVARLLRPEGVALLSVPAFPWLWTRHDESLHHVRRYTRGSLVNVLSEAGLSLRFVHYFNFWLFPPIALVRLFHRMTGGGPPHDFSLPPAFLNLVLERVFASEARRLAGGRGFPWGVGLLALAAKPDTPAAYPR